MDAPWSSYDLLSSTIVFMIGLYLFAFPDIFDHVGGIYAPLARFAEEWVWGILFTSFGGIGIITVLWCVRPSFSARLLSRMGVAFCLLAFALNNLVYSPPPLSSITYFFLSAWAMWGVIRTKSSGR